MGQEQIVGSFNWRGEDGVIALEFVFTARKLGEVSNTISTIFILTFFSVSMLLKVV